MNGPARALVALSTFAIALAAIALGLELARPHQAPAMAGADAGHTVYGANLSPIPPSVQVPAWYIDPANSTGCASDSNNGTSATCGSQPGIGPLSSWFGLQTYKWGCDWGQPHCPRIGATVNGDASVSPAVTVTFLSSHTDTSDPVVALPEFANGKYLALLGQPTQLCTGALTALTALNRSTPQLLNITLPATCQADAGVTLASGQLVVNTTHAGEAFLYTNVSGLNWSTSQPMTVPTVPPTTTATEVTTWTNGDTVTVYALPSVNLVKVSPNLVDFNAPTTNMMAVQHLKAYDPGGNAFDPMTIGPNVNVQSAWLSRTAFVDGALSEYPGSQFIGDMITGSMVLSNASALQAPIVMGGIVATGNLFGTAFLGADVIISANSTVSSPLYSIVQSGTQVYIETSRTLTVSGGGPIPNSANTIYWGPGTLNVAGDARLTYPAGASKAAAAFLQTGGFQLNGQTKACLAVPGAASAFATCNLTVSAANLDSNLGATTGCLTTGTAAICNY